MFCRMVLNLWMKKLSRRCAASVYLRFAFLTLLAVAASIEQAEAQFDTLAVGTRRYVLVNEEEALEVIQGQSQQLVEYHELTHHHTCWLPSCSISVRFLGWNSS